MAKVDVVCGGFPCPPFSIAGKRLGTSDERWLWPAFAACLRVVRPRYVVVENVADLIRFPDAFGEVLGNLHSLGFDAEWSVVSACAVGAPHVRERVFIVAHPTSVGPTGGGCTADASAWEMELARLVETPRWPLEDGPRIQRMAHGVPNEVDRRGAHGNAVVPQVAEVIGYWLRSKMNEHDQ